MEKKTGSLDGVNQSAVGIEAPSCYGGFVTEMNFDLDLYLLQSIKYRQRHGIQLGRFSFNPYSHANKIKEIYTQGHKNVE